MKHANNAFTLIETTLTLMVISLLILVGSQTLARPKVNHKQWLVTFHAYWQGARLAAQQNQRTIIVAFEKTEVRFDDQILSYPQGLQKHTRQTINILPTGYVAPTTIVLTGNSTVKLIFSLGGGDYRVETINN